MTSSSIMFFFLFKAMRLVFIFNPNELACGSSEGALSSFPSFCLSYGSVFARVARAAASAFSSFFRYTMYYIRDGTIALFP
jgi:hypothetical protein